MAGELIGPTLDRPRSLGGRAGRARAGLSSSSSLPQLRSAQALALETLIQPKPEPHTIRRSIHRIYPTPVPRPPGRGGAVRWSRIHMMSQASRSSRASSRRAPQLLVPAQTPVRPGRSSSHALCTPSVLGAGFAACSRPRVAAPGAGPDPSLSSVGGGHLGKVTLTAVRAASDASAPAAAPRWPGRSLAVPAAGLQQHDHRSQGAAGWAGSRSRDP